ncbi:MAG TPA: class I SAM-dependent methyltransferase [Aggregatilineales bacterium]|nr:class I SAM-dependent methyltransferase [Aggregatilineales bacterium]
MLHSNAQNFDSVADAYERGRPDYPVEAVNIIVQALGIRPESAVLDLAAGTGKFTRLLVPTRAHIIAVEPVNGMRTMLAKLVPDIEIWQGTAESIPIPDTSVDAVTVAQAFHWFQPEEATVEIHRVLRPEGGLALIWNRRNLNQPLQQAIDDIVTPYRGTPRTNDSLRWREGFDRTTLFTPLQEHSVPHSQNIDTLGLIDRVLSFSYMAKLPESDKEVVRERIRFLTSKLSDRFELMYTTSVFYCYSR